MDPKKVTKQTFDFYKSTFENTYNAMTMLQEQSQKMLEMYLDQTQGFPEEGKKAVQDWIKSYKKGSQDFKAAVDESFKKVEDFFAEAAKSVRRGARLIMGSFGKRSASPSLRSRLKE